jgi:hypothetical protein
MVRMEVKGMGCQYMDWIELPVDRVEWHVVLVVTAFWCHKRWEMSLVWEAIFVLGTAYFCYIWFYMRTHRVSLLYGTIVCVLWIVEVYQGWLSVDMLCNGNLCSQNLLYICQGVTVYINMVIPWPLNGVLSIQSLFVVLHFIYAWIYTKLFQCFSFFFFKFIYVEVKYKVSKNKRRAS